MIFGRADVIYLLICQQISHPSPISLDLQFLTSELSSTLSSMPTALAFLQLRNQGKLHLQLNTNTQSPFLNAKIFCFKGLLLQSMTLSLIRHLPFPATECYCVFKSIYFYMYEYFVHVYMYTMCV